MIQLDFDVASREEALARDPVLLGYSQHEGAEQAEWGADRLTLIDVTHPVVAPAAGSHANFFTSALFLGRSGAQGVGCDDTTGPSREPRPRVAVLPTAREDYLRAYPWLAFEGRWGELEPAFFNGADGAQRQDVVDAANQLVGGGVARAGVQRAGRHRPPAGGHRLPLPGGQGRLEAADQDRAQPAGRPVVPRRDPRHPRVRNHASAPGARRRCGFSAAAPPVRP